ncbi:unnamed protein product [Rhizophagus irregularis]|nr:unnamed protein product [Rhizophagus irregularis]
MIVEDLNSTGYSSTSRHLAFLMDDPSRQSIVQSLTKKERDNLLTDLGPVDVNPSRRPIAQPRRRKERIVPNLEPDTASVADHGTPPPEPTPSTNFSPLRRIARPRIKKNHFPPTPGQDF